MECSYNNENENIKVSIDRLQSTNNKRENFKSRMKTQLIITNGEALKQKLRNQKTIDLPINNKKQNDEFYVRYEEIEKIGEGCHSIVKKCLNKQNKEIYAVKIIRTDDIEIINQVKSEYEIVKKLKHECILRVYEMFVNESTGYVRLVTEYSNSITLKEFVEKSPNKQLTEQLSSKIISQLLNAISYLHSNNIVHRDIKTSNILINPESFKVTLIDFGISRFFDQSTDLYTPTGTPLYKAPEMIRGDPYNQSIDCWSLGITLFEILTGQKPFKFKLKECEMIEKMENQSFTNNIKFQSLSQNAQEFIKLLLNSDNYKRIKPQEGLNQAFIIRVQNENSILSTQDQNIPQINQSQLTTPQKNEDSNLKEQRNLTYSYEKNSFKDCLSSKINEIYPLKNSKNINNYQQQIQKINNKKTIISKSSLQDHNILREIQN